MKTAVIAITKSGIETAIKIGYCMEADVFVKNDFMNKCIINHEMIMMHPFSTDLKSLVEKIFKTYDALIFVMACGIVVRMIAPFIASKQKDPAVVVVDEKGKYAISLLSGHIGGANVLACRVAGITGGVPVITTSTDLNGMISFDVFAKKNNCRIENLENLKYISSEMVNGGKIYFFTDCRISGNFNENIETGNPSGKYKCAVVFSNRTDVTANADRILYIRPVNLIVGIGCRKGTSKTEIENAVNDFMLKNKKSLLSIDFLASIDLKKNEKGIIEFCEKRNIGFKTFSAEVIKQIEKRFAFSAFVKEKTGVGSVAEACAAIGGENAKLICPKTVYKGITLALAEVERVYEL